MQSGGKGAGRTGRAGGSRRKARAEGRGLSAPCSRRGLHGPRACRGHEGLGSAHPLRPPVALPVAPPAAAPGLRCVPGAGSYLGAPGSQLQLWSRAGDQSLRRLWLLLPGPSLPRPRGAGVAEPEKARREEEEEEEGEAGAGGGGGGAERAYGVWHRQSSASPGFALLRRTPSPHSSTRTPRSPLPVPPNPGTLPALRSAPTARTDPPPPQRVARWTLA